MTKKKPLPEHKYQSSDKIQSDDCKLNWIASYPKSGNTWVRLFLAAYRNFGYLPSLNMLGDTSDYAYQWYQLVSPKRLDELTPHETMTIRPAACYQILHGWAATGRIKPLVKTHVCNSSLFGYPTIPHNLTHRAVYVVRDPRDLVVSYARHMKMPVDQAIARMGAEGNALIEQKIVQPMNTWSFHVQSWKSKEYTHLIRYEDLLADPEKHFKAILNSIGLPFDQEIFDRAIAATTFERLKAAEAREGFKENKTPGKQFFNKGSAGYWKTALSPSQAKRIVKSHGPVMKELGYALD